MISEQRCHACGHRELLVGQPPSLPSPVCRHCGTQWADPNLSMDTRAQKTTLGEWIKSSDRAAKILERTVKRHLAALRMKNPPHPGDLIRTEVIESLNLSLTKAAKLLKVSRPALSKLLHGKTTLTPEMASRIERVFGPDMNHLLRMQFDYDLVRNNPA